MSGLIDKRGIKKGFRDPIAEFLNDEDAEERREDEVGRIAADVGRLMELRRIQDGRDRLLKFLKQKIRNKGRKNK